MAGFRKRFIEAVLSHNNDSIAVQGNWLKDLRTGRRRWTFPGSRMRRFIQGLHGGPITVVIDSNTRKLKNIK